MKAKETTPPKKPNYHLVGQLLFIGIFCAVVFGTIGYQWGYKNGQIEQNSTLASEQAKILDSQKVIIGQIMDYQIKHGSNTVQWGVNVNFVGGETDEY